MVTSSQILKATSLSAKTLTRWHQKGIIPKPAISTSPSGRGKLGYWPDWVLDRCKKIVELESKGHSLTLAAQLAELDSVSKFLKVEGTRQVVKDYDAQPAFGEKVLTFTDGIQVAFGDIFIAAVLTQLTPIYQADLIPALVSELRTGRAMDAALKMLYSGYSPILMIAGRDVHVAYDIVVSHDLSEGAAEGQPLIVLPLLSALRKAFATIDKELPYQPRAFPACKLVAKEKDGSMVEYDFLRDGPLGLDLIRESRAVIEK